MSPYTPLLRPDRYFAAHEVNFLRVMGILALLTFAGPLSIYGLGSILAANVDGTVMVDNPDRPPASFCSDDAPSAFYDREDCTRPPTIERNVDRLLWSAVDEIAGTALIAFPIAWLVTGIVLHVGSALVGGRDGVFPSLAVAAWGMLPTLLGLGVMLGVIWLWVEPYTVPTSAEPGTAFDPVLTQLEGLRPVTVVVSLLTTAWSAVIWRFGLEEYRGVEGLSAWLVAATAALIVASVNLL